MIKSRKPCFFPVLNILDLLYLPEGIPEIGLGGKKKVTDIHVSTEYRKHCLLGSLITLLHRSPMALLLGGVVGTFAQMKKQKRRGGK